MSSVTSLPALKAARQLFDARARGRVLVVPDGDADGLSAGALVRHAIERRGATAMVLHPPRGQHVHSPGVQREIEEARPDFVVVVDMGSRTGRICRVPTLVIDHHAPRGTPDGALLVSGAELDPVPSSSELAFKVLSPNSELEGLQWLAAFGAQGDRGARAAGKWTGQWRKKDLQQAVSLVNAANRSASHDVAAAFRALLEARGPADIVEGRSPEALRLRELREEVAAEVARCSRVAPRVQGRLALILFSSPARVHPLVAQRWVGRLSKNVVIAANVGYLPGRVNFAMRTALDVNLLELLRSVRLEPGEEVGYGHPGATGGSLPLVRFVEVMNALGFRDLGARPELVAFARSDA